MVGKKTPQKPKSTRLYKHVVRVNAFFLFIFFYSEMFYGFVSIGYECVNFIYMLVFLIQTFYFQPFILSKKGLKICKRSFESMNSIAITY